MNQILRLIILVTIGYLSILGYIYFNQTNLLFHPDEAPVGTIEDCDAFTGFDKVDVNGTKLYVRRDSPKKVIVYYHGNAGSVCHRADYIPVFSIDDYSLIFVGYESFINSEVTPSIANMQGDVERVTRYLQSEGYEDVVVVGRSLGSVFASYHASIHETKANILVSPLSSVLDIASSIYWYLPVSYLLKEDASNIDNLKNVESKTLILTGSADKTVPEEFSKRLLDTLSNAEYLQIERSNHSNILYSSEASEKIKDFLYNL